MIEEIRRALRAHARALGLDDGRIEIEPILNWGGFVNLSFRVSDGSRAVRLKLASDAGALAGLERWRGFATLLERRYHAPRMVGWMDASGGLLGGPVFEWIEGSISEGRESRAFRGVCALLRKLHDDVALARSLRELGDPVESCLEAYRRTYHRRFLADLNFIDSDPPPFAGSDAVAWMRSEALALEAHVAGLACFAEPADRPVHGDPWWNNLLEGPEAWYLLDWDGLTLGDPAGDWAMLCGPTREHVNSPRGVRPVRDALAPAARERLDAYARAALLDWIIDPLSDWVQAGVEPFHRDAVRQGNERVHREALAAYRKRYAGG